MDGAYLFHTIVSSLNLLFCLINAYQLCRYSIWCQQFFTTYIYPYFIHRYPHWNASRSLQLAYILQPSVQRFYHKIITVAAALLMTAGFSEWYGCSQTGHSSQICMLITVELFAAAVFCGVICVMRFVLILLENTQQITAVQYHGDRSKIISIQSYRRGMMTLCVICGTSNILADTLCYSMNNGRFAAISLVTYCITFTTFAIVMWYTMASLMRGIHHIEASLGVNQHVHRQPKTVSGRDRDGDSIIRIESTRTAATGNVMVQMQEDGIQEKEKEKERENAVTSPVVASRVLLVSAASGSRSVMTSSIRPSTSAPAPKLSMRQRLARSRIFVWLCGTTAAAVGLSYGQNAWNKLQSKSECKIELDYGIAVWYSFLGCASMFLVTWYAWVDPKKVLASAEASGNIPATGSRKGTAAAAAAGVGRRSRMDSQSRAGAAAGAAILSSPPVPTRGRLMTSSDRESRADVDADADADDRDGTGSTTDTIINSLPYSKSRPRNTWLTSPPRPVPSPSPAPVSSVYVHVPAPAPAPAITIATYTTPPAVDVASLYVVRNPATTNCNNPSGEIDMDINMHMDASSNIPLVPPAQPRSSFEEPPLARATIAIATTTRTSTSTSPSSS